MTRPFRLGAKLPSSGPEPERYGIPALARRLEDAGFASLWCSDHVVMTSDSARSTYPFSDDGRPGWDGASPWYDAIVVMAQAAAHTRTATIGCAVLVLPQRHPVILAKQVATLDALSDGRIALGVGVGWFREEFEALGVDFDTRGARFSEWLDLLRRCWSGRPEQFSGEHYRLPAGVIHEPTPRRQIPMLIGGTSQQAVRRAARQGDGWLGLQRAGWLDPAGVADAVARMRAEAGAAGRDPDELRAVLRIIESTGRSDAVAAAVPGLAAAGVDEIIVDTDWTGEGDADMVFERLADAASEVRT